MKVSERGESKREIVQYKYNILSYYDEPVPVDKRNFFISEQTLYN